MARTGDYMDVFSDVRQPEVDFSQSGVVVFHKFYTNSTSVSGQREWSHFRLTSVPQNCLCLNSLIAHSCHVFQGEVYCSQSSIFP